MKINSIKKIILLFSLVLGGFTFALSSANAQAVNIGNPLTPGFRQDAPEVQNEDIPSFVSGRLGKLVSTMFRILAVGSLIPITIGGIQLTISQGGPLAEKGKKTLFWGVVGLIVAFLGILVFDFLLTLLLPADPNAPR